jgi:hypothetical protein
MKINGQSLLLPAALAAFAFAAALPLASAQTLSPIVDGHVLRNQPFVHDPVSGAKTCTRANNCVETFVYFDKIYVGGQNSFLGDFDPDDGKDTLFYRDSRPIFEFDITSAPATASATFRFTTTGNFYPDAPDTPLAVTLYRLSAADSNGVLTSCDFNAAGGGFDGQRWITLGCSNLVMQPIAAKATLDTVTFPSTWSVDVTSAFAAAKAAGQSRLGLAVGADQGADPLTDTNFDGDELQIAPRSTTQGATLTLALLAPNISVDETSCPGTTVGQPVDIPIVVRNSGSGALQITSMTERAGSDSCSAFSFDPLGLPVSIPAGGSQTFELLFSPSKSGTCGVLVEIASNDPDSPLVQREISCEATTGPGAKISVTPSTFDCGPIPINSTDAKTVTITNSGLAPLVIASVSESSDPSGSYLLVTDSLVTNLAPGTSTSFRVLFAPTTAGTFPATFTIASNATNAPTFDVRFSCTATECGVSADQTINVLSATPACTGVPVGGSSSTFVTVQNLGRGQLEISRIDEIVDAGGAFWIDTESLQRKLNCGQQSSFRVVFAPPGPGSYTSTFRVVSNDPARPTVDIPFACSTSAPTLETIAPASALATAGTNGRIVAASANSPGFADTYWVTDLKVENTSPEDSSFRILFLRANQPNATAPSASFRLAPGATLAIDDVVGTGLFGQSSVSGAILVLPTSPADSALVVASRTYNRLPAGQPGTFGQYIGGVAPVAAVDAGSPQWLAGLACGVARRTNVGAVNLGSTLAKVRFEIRNGADGALLGSPVEILLDPFGQKQVNLFGSAGIGSQEVPHALAKITLVEGSTAVAYASVIDNLSGDPIYVPSAK